MESWNGGFAKKGEALRNQSHIDIWKEEDFCFEEVIRLRIYKIKSLEEI